MASRRSINARAKGVEVTVQQFLWPGTSFSGGAKRPALEDQDLCGTDSAGRVWWGEVKNDSAMTILNKGGVWKVLLDAYNQVCNAIERNKDKWCLIYSERPIPFSVLWPKGSRLDIQRLVMLDDGGLIVIPLVEFKLRYIEKES